MPQRLSQAMLTKLIHKTCFLLLSTALLLSSQANADEVTVVSNFWPPYNGTPSNPSPGYVIEIAEYALAKGGHSLKYQLWSWDKSIQMVREGKRNCLIGDLRSIMPDFIYPQLHIGADQKVFMRRKGDDWQYSGIDSLDNIKLGTVHGYSYSQIIKLYITNPENSHRTTNTKGKFALEFNLSSLMNGEIDAVIESKNVLFSTLIKHEWKNEVELAGIATGINKINFACSPAIEQSKDYVNLIDEGIKELRSSGQLDTILLKYGLKDWRALPAKDN